MLLGVATLLALVDSGQTQYERVVEEDPISWSHSLIHGFPRWYLWALLVPLVIWICRGIERLRVGEPSATALHCLGGPTVVALHIVLLAPINSWLHGNGDVIGHLQSSLVKYFGLTFFSGLVTYAAIVGGWYAWGWYSEQRHRSEAESELRTLLAEAQVRQMQAQLQPHFLFNSLHALSGLIYRGDRTEAVRMTARLSEFLRDVLEYSSSNRIELETEVDLVRRYLAVQQTRFGDRLTVKFNIATETRECLVPVMLLQPLVENAVDHGVERSERSSLIAITSKLLDGDLVITVVDDGVGLEGDPVEGTGLGNIRARLATMYGDRASFSLRPREDARGAVAKVVLPRGVGEVVL